MKRLGGILTGLALIGLAFFAGSQRHPVMGMLGFLCFFVGGVTFIAESFRKPKPLSAEALIHSARLEHQADKLVVAAGIDWMNEMEGMYRGQIENFGSKPAAAGIFGARIFALYFAVSAMRLAFGSPAAERSEKIWRLLSAEAGRGLNLPASRQQEIAAEIVSEQSHALAAEQRNVGSGQYALAALYEKAVEESTGPAAGLKTSGTEPAAVWAGRATAWGLGHWYELYRQISGRPAQNYNQGFVKSAGDSRRLEEGN